MIVPSRSREFLSADPQRQTEMVWESLLGEGALPIAEAVPISAERLREDGFLGHEQRARGTTAAHAAIERAIQSGLERRIFDAPRRGHVRAVLSKLDAEHWRACLLTVVPTDPISRADALSEALRVAGECFGAKFSAAAAQRAVEAALKSCIKTGLIENLGAGLIARPSVPEDAVEYEGDFGDSEELEDSEELKVAEELDDAEEPDSAQAKQTEPNEEPPPRAERKSGARPRKAELPEAPRVLDTTSKGFELPEVGLMIRAEPMQWILDGKKTWELRSRRTERRGRIALITSRSGTVVGEANLVDVVGPLTEDLAEANAAKMNHQLPDPSEETYAWVLADVRRYDEPVPYKHPSGAVIWVRLR